MKKVFITLSAILLTGGLHAQQADSLKVVKLDAVVVSATRVSSDAPVAVSNLNEGEIKKENAAKNIPALLQTLPSVVSYTEGGNTCRKRVFPHSRNRCQPYQYYVEWYAAK